MLLRVYYIEIYLLDLFIIFRLYLDYIYLFVHYV